MLKNRFYSTLLHPNIGWTVFDPMYHDEIKREHKFELSFLNVFYETNETNETNDDFQLKKNKPNILVLKDLNKL